MPSMRIGAGQHQHVAVERDELAHGDRAVDRLAGRRRAAAPARPSWGRKPMNGRVEGAQPGGDHRLVEHAPGARRRSARSWRSSCANALTTRTPPMFSSASAVSSAMRCCTSCAGRAGCGARSGTRSRSRTASGRARRAASRGLSDEHHGRGDQDRERRLEDEDQAVAEEEAHRLEVDGRARHQLPGLLARRRSRARATAGARTSGCAGRTRRPSETLARPRAGARR